MSEAFKVTFKSRQFIDLLTDALRFSGVAHMSAPADLRTAAAKASVLHCVFCLEATANSLLSDLDYSSRLREATDRFQTLEKFEFVLYHISQRIMDRGTRQVQAVAQLLKVRNDYVHPKIRSADGAFSEANKTVDYPDEKYDVLGIPVEPRRWHYDSAKLALVTTDNFLRYYLLDLCGFTPPDAMATLLPVLNTPDGPKQVFVVEHRDVLIKAKEGMGLSFAYLDLTREFDSVITDTFGGCEDSSPTADGKKKGSV